MMTEPLALRAYEKLAEHYAALIDTKPHNALYERPSTLSLLPEVAEKRVLDAGCGPGVYSELLLDQGAKVIAVDVSPAMVEHARQRLGARATVLHANLEEPLTFAETSSFDLIVSSLVIDYIRDLTFLFQEFFRALKSPGYLVFSIGHPFGDFMRHPEGSYFQSQVVEETWRGFGIEVTVPFNRRPLEAILKPLFDASFLLDRLLEPVPLDEFKQFEPEDYEKIMKEPAFMSLRALKTQ